MLNYVFFLRLKLRFLTFPPVIRSNWMHLWRWRNCNWWWWSTWLWRLYKDLRRSAQCVTAGRQHLQLSLCGGMSAVCLVCGSFSFCRWWMTKSIEWVSENTFSCLSVVVWVPFVLYVVFFFLSLGNDKRCTNLLFSELGANDKVSRSRAPSVVSLWWNEWCWLECFSFFFCKLGLRKL